MKILIMGSGAVGGYFGGVLSRAGHEVAFVARGSHLEAINRSGLRVESDASGVFEVRASAMERPDGSWKADVILYCREGLRQPHGSAYDWPGGRRRHGGADAAKRHGERRRAGGGLRPGTRCCPA